MPQHFAATIEKAASKAVHSSKFALEAWTGLEATCRRHRLTGGLQLGKPSHWKEGSLGIHDIIWGGQRGWCPSLALGFLPQNPLLVIRLNTKGCVLGTQENLSSCQTSFARVKLVKRSLSQPDFTGLLLV